MITPEEKACWVSINHFIKIGPRRFKILLDNFPNLLELQHTSIQEITVRTGLSYQIIRELKEHLQQTNPHELFQKIEEQGISILTLKDEKYPTLLSNIYDPPPVLYWKGSPEVLNKLKFSLAIIGTRKASFYGKAVARQLGRQSAQAGIAVISGLAYGIDEEAHIGALESTLGCTVAVLGCGVDIVYPRKNKTTYQAIAQRGLLISEFPPGFQPKPWTFPMRNRIVSGLSQGVIVVEAGLKSGTLITVDCANEQGREVFAVPGMITSKQSLGTHALIQDGAHLLTNIEEVFEVFNWDLSLNSGTEPQINLTPEEKKVYTILENNPQHIDIISERCQGESTSIASTLMTLEIKGIIEQLPGKLFLKKSPVY